MSSEQRPGERYLDYRARMLIERRDARREYSREARRWQTIQDRQQPPHRTGGIGGIGDIIFILGDDGSPQDDGPKE